MNEEESEEDVNEPSMIEKIGKSLIEQALNASKEE